MPGHEYDTVYYDYLNIGSTRSADVVIGLLGTVLRARSVIDFGSGEGAWLAVWQKHGVTDVFGVDGSYVLEERLLVPATQFRAADLSKPITLGRTFDIVQSLEVAEHLAPDCADVFVDTLVRHGSCVLFSAAPPGQGGEHHVNERPHEYWRQLFARRGYEAFDWLRPQLRHCPEVEPWYRYNALLFVHESVVAELDPAVRTTIVPRSRRLADVSPLAYRIMKALVRSLPTSASTALAVLKKHYVVWRHRRLQKQQI